jgi:gluconolactonase
VPLALTTMTMTAWIVPRYEHVAPAFASFVLHNAALELPIEGCRWLDGPVWFADHQVLLVSDIPNDRILRVTERAEVSVFRQPAEFPNGHARDGEGRLIGCSHQHRAIIRTGVDGEVQTLVDRYQGKRPNAPNDVVVRSDGTIWFTDPHYGIETDYEGGKQRPELPPSVYCLDPRSSELTLVADDFYGPNGLAFSPDDRTLYIAESGTLFVPDPKRMVRAFDVDAYLPRLLNGHDFHAVSAGYTDGLRCDVEGNVWATAGDGIHVLLPAGELLGKILLPGAVQNLCFGGLRRSRLFVCAGVSLYALSVNRRGAQCP